MNHSPVSATETPVLIQAVIETLNQGETMLQEIDDAGYVRKMPAAFNASIGGHYRHCLDHFRSLLEAAAGETLNYDHRQRDPMIENDRFAALHATRSLREEFLSWTEAHVARRVHVQCKTSYAAGASQAADSTLGREIMYSVAHAVHHYALIGVMAGLQGIAMPEGFGVAPSTLKHRAQLATAA